MWRTITRAATALVTATAICALAAPAAPAQSPGEGPGGPVLVVVDSGNDFGRYYAEILRAEGLNEFAVADVDTLSPGLLSAYQVVLVAEAPVDATQASMLSSWVSAGGNLIAMRPDDTLGGLLGLGGDTGDISNQYVTVAQSGPGAGITDEAMQFHGTADVRTRAAGTQQIAALSGGAPAVTMRSFGAGQAAAFTYDLARSVVLTRQGDPSRINQDFDGTGPIRSNDLFQAGWLDMSKVRIPQADEQQRLLANLITQMNLDRAPLPRFWYLPRGEQAAVVMTGDDHAVGGTATQLNRFQAADPPNCSYADWQCVRTTSYVYPGSPLTNAQAAAFQAAGFEIALHLNTGCGNGGSLDTFWTNQLADFATDYPSIRDPRTNRTHCIVWNNWIDEPLAELAHGVRFDTNYYYWPGSWALSHPGLFTGSGFPMRFADTDGSMVDVYQAATQLTDEWGDAPNYAGVATHIKALIDGALGPDGYYGVFTANMHTDDGVHAGADAIVEEAQNRGVPVVSAEQMLDWVDGRNASSFKSIGYSGGRLSFTVARDLRARGLQGMVPARSGTGALSSLTRNGVALSAPVRRIKGVDYAVFDATSGSYVVTYGTAAVPMPDTAITQATVTGDRALFAFSGSAASSFQCRMDGAAFTACANPTAYTRLARGAHAFQVRAVGAGGRVDPTPAEHRFTVAAKPTTPGSGNQTTRSPKVRLSPARVEVSKTGRVRLRVTCTLSDDRCRVSLKLRAGGKTLASKTVQVGGRETRSVRLTLRPSAWQRLLLKQTWRVTAVAVSRDSSGARAVTRKKLRLAAP
jgi:hypothetical protein